MEVSRQNPQTPIYSLTSGPSLPEWLGERARRNLSKRDSSIRRRIELLQDFTMPSSSSRIVQSPNGQFLLVSGTYPPRIKCYEMNELGMKFERYVDGEINDMLFLGHDYGKFVLLLDNRTLEFHAPYGKHESTRIPRPGRALGYEPTTCELFVASASAASSSGPNNNSNNNNGGGGGGEVYRFNLEEGRFAQPFTYSGHMSSSGSDSGAGSGATCLAISPSHPLTALGCEDGMIRFWDNRTPSHHSHSMGWNVRPFLHLNVAASSAAVGTRPHHDDNDNDNIMGMGIGTTTNPGEITSLTFDSSGLYMAAGTAGGKVALYDVRSSNPLLVKEHRYGLPIHTVAFHGTTKKNSGNNVGDYVLSGDRRVVKIWRSKPSAVGVDSSAHDNDDDYDFGYVDGENNNGGLGSVLANVEGVADFTHFMIAGDEKDPKGEHSGLILCAAEQPKMEAFYIPALGNAPRWCSFLDSITEELEERDKSADDVGSSLDPFVAGGGMVGGPGQTVYENYKFLTREEIESLGISKLIGTPLLRGYMHGFFVHVDLYNKVRAVANPFEYEEYRKKRIRDKIEEKRASRIAPKKVDNGHKTRKKNDVKVNPELASRLVGKAGETTKAGKVAQKMLQDERFGSLFTNPDYQIDEEDINFKLRNPSGVSAKNRRDAADEDMDSDRDDSDEDRARGGDALGFSRIDSDEEDGGWGDEGDSHGSEPDDYESESGDEDGFRGVRICGEKYHEVKALEREIKTKNKQETKKRGDTNSSKQKKKAKTIMYEAHDYNDGLGGNSTTALGIGLGDTSAATIAKRRRDEMNMTLEERLKEQKSRGKKFGETEVVKVRRGDGMTKEATYIPKDARKRMDKGDDQKQGQGERKDGQSRRKRRDIKDLGFKTPFKNKMG